MNNVRLVCGGYSVDLPTDFGIQINKSIADIREPESRSSDWTKTFTLPGTKTNNKLFTHLFDLNLSIRNTTSTNFSPDFNPNLKADALLTVDEVTQIEGFIRLLSIKVNDLNQIEYECSMHGELADLFAKISDGKLSDLNFAEYNHIMNDTNIFNSWDTSIVKNGSSGYVNFSGGAPIGEGYIYGWMDNGYYQNYRNLNTDDMTIFLYAKTVVDKIFSGAGYSYSSGSFFNTAQFKRLVIPCPTRMPVLTEQAVLNRQFDAKRSTDTTYAVGDKLVFDTEISDPSNQYNNTTGQYTVDYSGPYDIILKNNATVSGLTPGTTYQAFYTLIVNGNDARIMFDWDVANASGVITLNNYVPFDYIYLNDGDVVEIRFDYVYQPGGGGSYPNPATYTYTQKTNSRLFNQVWDIGWGYGKDLNLDSFFSTDIKQREFMKWIFTMFNLYVEPTEMNKTLLVLPREEFLTNTVRDWTEKRDLSQPLEITPMGELDAGKYLFTYSEGDDDDNKAYKQDYDRNYGDRRIIVENDFVKEEKKVEIGFQPTFIVRPQNEDKFFAGNSTDNQDGKGGKLRILQYSKQSCGVYAIWYGKRNKIVSLPSTTKTEYPFFGHLDNPLASTTDINFGLPRYIGLPSGTPVTNNNLYNAYWSKYINEISDKDSKLVKGNFYLTPADMEKLSFRDLYFFDGNYFRLNKIEDYDPINPSVNICEFLFLKTGPTFSATTGSVGGGGTQSSGGGGQETEYDPYDGSNLNGRVIQNKGFSLGDFNDAGSGIFAGDAVTNYGRANAAFATTGTTFLPDSERSIVIGEGVQAVGSDEVWLQGHEMTQVNFSTNRIQFTTAATVTADLYKDIYIMDLSTNTTLNLPNATTCTGKAYYVYKNSSAHQLIIDPYEAQLIDDGATYVLGTHYECVQIVSDGTQWRVISKK